MIKFLAYISVFSIPALIRFIPWRQFITPERIYFYGTDPYDHMRRVSLILNNFPHLPDYTYYQVYPKGTPMLSAPLLDFVIALIAKIIGLGSPSERTVEHTGALIPPLIASLSVFAFYLLAKELMSKKAAMSGSLLFGLMPAYLNFSFVGQPDNNMIEPFLFSIYFLFVIKAVRTDKVKYSVLASLMGIVSILMWRGSTIFWFIAFGMLVILFLMEKKDSLLKTGAFLFMGKGLVLFLLGMGGIMGVRDAMLFREVSYFHALFCTSAGAGFIAAYWGFRRYGFAGAALFFVPLAISIMLVPGFSEQLLEPLRMAGQTDVFFRGNVEYAPILAGDGWRGIVRPVAGSPAAELTFFFWLVPIGLLWYARRFISFGAERVRMSFLFLSTAAFFVLTISHMRFANLLAVSVSLMAALFIDRLILPAKARMKAALWAFFALMVLPAAFPLYGFSKGEMRLLDTQKEHFEAMDWMRLNTPATSHFYEPGIKPEYGVLGEWSLSSWIENVARRPTVSTNWTSDPSGVLESIRFMMAASESDAIAVLERNNVRYVIITNIIAGLEDYAVILGIPGGYAELVEGSQPRGSWVPGRKYFGLVSTSLLLANGMPDDGGGLPVTGMPLQRLRHFRLVFESSSKLKSMGLPRPVSKIKVFEYVREGARPPANSKKLS